MSKDSIYWQIQKSIYNILHNNIHIANITNDIYNYVPQNSKYPYIVIDIQNIDNISTKTDNIQNINYHIHIFTREKTNKTLLFLTEQTIQSLNKKMISSISGNDPTNANIFNIAFQNTKFTRKSDGTTIYSTINMDITII